MNLVARTVTKEKLSTTSGAALKWRTVTRLIAAAFAISMTTSCFIDSASTRPSAQVPHTAISSVNVDDLLVVDCLLPGQIKRLGQKAVFVGPRRPIKTAAVDCAIRGGEYVAHDRSNYETARKIWLSRAESGDKVAQNYLGEIYEKGLGTEPNHAVAADWYRRAAEQRYAPAQMNLGKLYESGLGRPKDMKKALYWYRRASSLPDLQLAPELQLDTDTHKGSGPIIKIIEPLIPATRGLVLIPAKPGATERLIVGRVLAPAGLLALTVNDRDTPVESNGIFHTSISTEQSGSKVTIIAIDKLGKRAERTLAMRPTRRLPSKLDFGGYHAVVIGNNAYRYLTPLVTARSDARAVAELLEKKYGFKVTSLYDATRFQVLNTLNHLRKTLTEDDNLLIYYAGHGELDTTNDRGHWLPVDAQPDSSANWISNTTLTDILNIMSARHVLVVADSCYSGTLTRSVLTQLRPGHTDQARATYYQTVLKKRSRTALTSGALAPTLDSGSNGHSVFADALINILKSNNDVLEGQRLFLEVAERVTRTAYNRRFEQIPQYAPIKFAGHEAGDFFLVPQS